MPLLVEGWENGLGGCGEASKLLPITENKVVGKHTHTSDQQNQKIFPGMKKWAHMKHFERDGCQNGWTQLQVDVAIYLLHVDPSFTHEILCYYGATIPINVLE